MAALGIKVLDSCWPLTAATAAGRRHHSRAGFSRANLFCPFSVWSEAFCLLLSASSFAARSSAPGSSAPDGGLVAQGAGGDAASAIGLSAIRHTTLGHATEVFYRTLESDQGLIADHEGPSLR